MAEKNESEMTADELLAKAADYERQAEEMKSIGDHAAAHSFKMMAEGYLEEAAARG